MFRLTYTVAHEQKIWNYCFAIQALTVSTAMLDSLSFIIVGDVLYGSIGQSSIFKMYLPGFIHSPDPNGMLQNSFDIHE